MSLDLERKTRVIRLIDVCYMTRRVHSAHSGSSCTLELATRNLYDNCELARAGNCSLIEVSA